MTQREMARHVDLVGGDRDLGRRLGTLGLQTHPIILGRPRIRSGETVLGDAAAGAGPIATEAVEFTKIRRSRDLLVDRLLTEVGR